MRTWFALLLAACTADEPGDGPTFGGASRWQAAADAIVSGQAPSSADMTLSGFLAAFPLAMDSAPCDAPVCVAARAAWNEDDDLLVGLSVEGRPGSRPPTDALLLVDLSGSVVDDGRRPLDRAADLAIAHLRADDSLGIIAFRSQAYTLVPPTTTAGQADLWEASNAMRDLPDVERQLPWLRDHLDLEPCDLDAVTVEEALTTCADAPQTEDGTHLCGELWPADEDELSAAQDAVSDWVAWEDSANASLAEAMPDLMCDSGTSLTAAMDEALPWLLPGTTARGTRLFLVSDLADPAGGEQTYAALRDASLEHVGTTVITVGEDRDRVLAGRIADLPGGLMFDTTSSPDSLITLDARYDDLLVPRAWGLVVEPGEGWSPVFDEPVGATSVFGSEGHGVLPLLIRRDDAAQTSLDLTLTLEAVDHEEVGVLPVLVPVGLLEGSGCRADDHDALDLCLELQAWAALRSWAETGTPSALEELRETLKTLKPASELAKRVEEVLRGAAPPGLPPPA